jgi:hypothetical protein
MSISVWVKLIQNGSAQIVSDDKTSTGTYLGSLGTFSSHAFIFGIYKDNANHKNWQSPDESYVPNKWTHIVVTRSGTALNDGDVTMYVNGSPVTLTPTVLGTPAMPAYSAVADWYAASLGDAVGSFTFYGAEDDLRMYNRVLSAGEVQALYKMGTANAAHSNAGGPALQNGLVGYWPFDGNTTNWNTGLTKDLSGLGDDGTLTLLSTTSGSGFGKIGQAILFNVDQSMVTTALNDAVMPEGQPMTFSAWIKEVGRGSVGDFGASTIFTRGGLTGIVLTTSGSDLDFQAATNANNTQRSITSGLTVGTWQHLVVTWDGGVSGAGVHFYINGVEPSYSTTKGTGSLTDNSGSPFVIGGRPGASRTFNGLEDDVRVYNRVLSLPEIQALYNMGK